MSAVAKAGMDSSVEVDHNIAYTGYRRMKQEFSYAEITIKFDPDVD